MRHGVRLGIDPGDARIGVARSDPSGFLASPVETVRRGKGDLARIAKILAAEQEESTVVEVVVGLPRSLSGGEGPAAVKVREFAAEPGPAGRAGAGAARRRAHDHGVGGGYAARPWPQGEQAASRGRPGRRRPDPAARTGHRARDGDRARGDPRGDVNDGRVRRGPRRRRRSWTTESDGRRGRRSAYEGGSRRGARRGATCPAASPSWSRWRSSSAASTSSSPGASTSSATSSRSAEDYPGPGSGKVTFEVEGRHRRRDGPQPQGRRRGRLRRGVHRRRERQPGLQQHPGRLLPAEEGDGVRGRRRGPGRPGQHREVDGHHPRGAAGRGHRRDPRQEDRLLEGRLQQGARRTRRKLGLPDYADGNPEGYLFPATYDFGPDATPDVDAHGDGHALAPGRRRRRPRGRGRGARLHAAGADDGREPGAGRGPRRRHAQDRPGHLQPASRTPTTA